MLSQKNAEIKANGPVTQTIEAQGERVRISILAPKNEPNREIRTLLATHETW